jgi:hypothetical protein
MNSPANPIDPTALDTCGCCQPVSSPEPVFNRPGLPALSYRIGTHATFLNRMLADLNAEILPDGTTLAALTTRAPDDPAIALLDAWATVADVLTFYQERIANEGYLRTADERLSVLQLARAIGYELSPGVAASTYLAFTLQDAPGSPATVAIATGTKVQSVPPQGKFPQTFETIEDIVARPGWNALHPKLSYPQRFNTGDKFVFLQGTGTQLQVGDAILIVGDERANNSPPAEGTTKEDQWDFRILSKVVAYPDLNITQVFWDDGLGGTPGMPSAKTNPRVYALRQRVHIFGYNAPDWRSMSSDVKKAYDPEPQDTTKAGTATDWPGITTITSAYKTIDLDVVYPKLFVNGWIVLAQHYGQDSGSPPLKELYRITRATPAGNANFTLTGSTTRLELDASDNLNNFARRLTTAHTQSEEVPWVDRPFTNPDPANPIVTLNDPVSNQSIDPVGGPDRTCILLDGVVQGLAHQQSLIISGKWIRLQVASSGLTLVSPDGTASTPINPKEILQVLGATPAAQDGTRIWHVRVKSSGSEGYITALPSGFTFYTADKNDPVVSEAVVVDSVELAQKGKSSKIALLTPVQNIYEPQTVTIYANVARATHGETVKEVLGSGDASQFNQSFTLKKPPLTYISASTPSGTQSTLQVRIDGVLWTESPSLYGLGPRDDNFVVRIDNSGKSTLTFGDGSSGQRPPTGVENITATYRSGIGLDGNVDANILTMLQTRPLGVRSVTNPLPATGAADPEKLDQARAHAPLKVQTLDRIVSLEDYENFAAAFAGIGKAQCAAIWNQNKRIVFLTVAGEDGSVLDPSSAVLQNLVLAIWEFHDPVQQVQVGAYTSLTFSLQATVLVDPRYMTDVVVGNVQAALLDSFSFAKRNFAQPVTGAEVVTVMQGVTGVVAVELENLAIDASFAPASSATLNVRSKKSAGGLTSKPRNSFIRRKPPDSPTSSAVDTILPANIACFNGGAIQPAELLLIRPTGITLKGTNP